MESGEDTDIKRREGVTRVEFISNENFMYINRFVATHCCLH